MTYRQLTQDERYMIVQLQRASTEHDDPEEILNLHENL